MRFLKNKFVILSGFILAIFIGFLVFISPIAKYILQKYDKVWLGREITVDWVYLNPFTGYVYLGDLVIYEQNGDSIFFTADAVAADMALFKLFSKTYEFSYLTITKPRGVVVQNVHLLNFSDLIDRFSSKADSTSQKKAAHVNILNIKIKEGAFYYKELVTPINYFIKIVDIESSGYRWDVDTIPIQFSFFSGLGEGNMKGNFTINTKNKDYKLKVLVKRFDLNIVGQYIKDLANYGSFKAYLDADFTSLGNFEEKGNISNSGLIQISDFHFGKDPKDDYLSFDTLLIKIKEVTPKKMVYYFDSVYLSKPYFKFERYDYLDNLQTTFGVKGGNLKEAKANVEKFNLVIEIAKYLKLMSRNLLKSDYRVNHFWVRNGNFRFNDFTLNEQFSIALNPVNFTADSIYKKHKRVNFELQAGVKPFGELKIDISVDPKDTSNFDLEFYFHNISAATFNPYLVRYTGYPLERGTIRIYGNWRVRNSNIQSQNHLIVIDPRLHKRVANKNIKRIPMPIVMALVREQGNVIDYEIPISGDLKNAKFHLKDAILDVLVNIFVKPPTTAYRIKVNSNETEIEKSLALTWGLRSADLTKTQQRFLHKLSMFLLHHPEEKLVVTQQLFRVKEEEYILLYEAKKKYYLHAKNALERNFTPKDAALVERISIKESGFVRYVNSQITDSLLFTIQDKCLSWLGKAYLTKAYNKLSEERMSQFFGFFKEENLKSRIQVRPTVSKVPFNGFSFLSIKYIGVLPNDLLRAYIEMNELNNKNPRKLFNKTRKPKASPYFQNKQTQKNK